jgi:hypothetical protein
LRGRAAARKSALGPSTGSPLSYGAWFPILHRLSAMASRPQEGPPARRREGVPALLLPVANRTWRPMPCRDRVKAGRGQPSACRLRPSWRPHPISRRSIATASLTPRVYPPCTSAHRANICGVKGAAAPITGKRSTASGLGGATSDTHTMSALAALASAGLMR